jgi:AraC family transcriptional activator of pobA
MSVQKLPIVVEQEIANSFSVKELNAGAPDSAAITRLNYHRILLLEQGTGQLQIDDQLFELSGQEVFLMAKGQFFLFLSATGLTGYELSFGDCFWEKSPASASNCKAVLFNNASANQQLPAPGAAFQELQLLFNVLYAELAKEDYINKPDALAAYLKIIMIKLANLNAPSRSGLDNYENRLYRQFLELASKNYHATHEVAAYAIQLGISPRKLSDLCKHYSGKGAKEIIDGQLIAEAKRLLQFSAIPVKEIAYQLNFSTPDHFSHFFKKKEQLSPQDYRLRFVNIGM